MEKYFSLEIWIYEYLYKVLFFIGNLKIIEFSENYMKLYYYIYRSKKDDILISVDNNKSNNIPRLFTTGEFIII